MGLGCPPEDRAPQASPGGEYRGRARESGQRSRNREGTAVTYLTRRSVLQGSLEHRTPGEIGHSRPLPVSRTLTRLTCPSSIFPPGTGLWRPILGRAPKPHLSVDAGYDI